MDSKNYSPNQWVSTLVFSIPTCILFESAGLDKQTTDYVLNHIILKNYSAGSHNQSWDWLIESWTLSNMLLL